MRRMNFLTRNLLWKLLALATAFAVWLSVASEPELATIVSVPVEYNNLPKDLEISSDIVETIDVEARGPAGQLRSLHDSRIAAIIDFSSVHAPGERTFTLTTAELKLPARIVITGCDDPGATPVQLRESGRLGKLRSRSTCRSRRKLPGRVFSSPESILRILRNWKSSGPESHVLGSGKLVSDPFDLTNVTGDTSTDAVRVRGRTGSADSQCAAG